MGHKKTSHNGKLCDLWLVSRRDFFPREQIEASRNLRTELEKVRCSKKSGIFCGITKRALGDRPLRSGGRETFSVAKILFLKRMCRVPNHDECSYFFRACSRREKKLDGIEFLIRMESYNADCALCEEQKAKILV